MKPIKLWDALDAYNKAKDRKYENPTGSMLVALDNDEPARNAASALVKIARAELPEVHEVLADALLVVTAVMGDYPRLAGIEDLHRRLEHVLANAPDARETRLEGLATRARAALDRRAAAIAATGLRELIDDPHNPAARRGVDYPCEGCHNLVGSKLVDGWWRCAACGYPGK